MAGSSAVDAVVNGISNKMVAFKRESNSPYKIVTTLAPLCEIAHGTQSMPDEYIGKDGCSVTQAFIDYATPLISGEVELQYKNGLPVFAKLKKDIISL
jgi:6-phosphofructokinase 1